MMHDKSQARNIFHSFSVQPDVVSLTGHRQRIVGIDRNVLTDAFLAADGQLSAPVSLRFNLFDDVHVILHTCHTEAIGDDGLSWRGNLSGTHHVHGHLAILGIRGGTGVPWVFAGSVRIGEQRYVIESVGIDMLKISEESETSLLCETHAPQCDVAADRLAQDAPLSSGGDGEQSAPSNPISAIRILAVYPGVLREVTPWGGKGIGAKLYLAASITNDVFARSRIPACVEIIYREVEALTVHDDVLELLAEVSNAYAPCTNPAAREVVNELREELKADIVLLLCANVTDNEGATGVASAIPEPPRTDASDLDNAIMAVAVRRGEQDVIGAYTLPHELGHLMGAKHAYQTMPDRGNQNPMYDHVRGYEAEDRSFGTVMSYSRHRIPYFSDADMQWEGKPMGIPYGIDNAASAAPFLRTIAPVIASYRSSLVTEERYVTLSTAVLPELGGTLVVESMGPYSKGSQIKVTVVPRGSIYRFSRWLVDGKPHAGSDLSITLQMDHNHTLTAVFDAENTTIAMDTRVVPEKAGLGGIVVDPAATRYDAGSDIAFVAPPNTEAYAFLTWRLDGSPAGTGDTLYLRAVTDHLVEAVFGAREFKVAIESIPAPAGDINCNSSRALSMELNRLGGADGQSLTFRAEAKAGHAAVFQFWRINGQKVPGRVEGSFTYLDVLLQNDTHIEACFDGWDQTFRVNVSTNIEAWADIVPSVQILRNGHSVMQAAPGSAFPAGSTVFFADPLSATGLYRFLNWQVDEGVSQEEVQILGTRYLKILVSKDMNIQAVFEPIPS
jgi:hypothetical protein